MDDPVRFLRNFAIKGFMHLLGLALLAWVIGAIMAYFTNQVGLIGFNTDSILVTYKWTMWLIESWSLLTWDAYSWIKLKLILCLAIPFIAALVPYIMFFDRMMDWDPIEKKEKVFGNAAWATQADIKKARLRCKEGMLLGVDKGGYFVADGFQHALLFAPTGAGKGVGFVIPNLLFWQDSVVVHDIKLENHQLTSGWRAKNGQQVFVWEPSNPDGVTHCYNPIDWVSNKPGQMVDDVQKISSLIMPKQEFWENEARSLFLGVMLYLISDPAKPKSFGEAVRALRSDDVVYNFAVALDTLGGVMHPVGYMNLAAFLQKADQERSGVVSTLNSGLELWANPLIDAATASSDFNVLEFKKKKTTVYVGLTPDNIQRLQKLMQVFYQQSTEFLSRKMPNLKEEPYGVMFLLDEFPTLGKMEQFKSGIAYFRGYRVRLFLIIQDTQQLKGTYEEAGMNSFLSNSTFRITFAANNYETANLISQLCGNKTVEQASKSKPQFFDLNPATKTMNISEVSRALLLPQEVIGLPRDEQIVLIESQPPIRSKKIFYYQDKFFTSRLIPPTFVPTQKPYDPRENKVGDDTGATEGDNQEEKVEEDEFFEADEVEVNDYDEGIEGESSTEEASDSGLEEEYNAAEGESELQESVPQQDQEFEEGISEEAEEFETEEEAYTEEPIAEEINEGASSEEPYADEPVTDNPEEAAALDENDVVTEDDVLPQSDPILEVVTEDTAEEVTEEPNETTVAESPTPHANPEVNAPPIEPAVEPAPTTTDTAPTPATDEKPEEAKPSDQK